MGRKLLLASGNREDATGLAEAFCGLSDVELLPVARTGRAAVDTLFTHDVDLLLLDLFLPDMDGLSVLDCIGRLKEDRRPLVFVITALTDDRLIGSIKDKIVYCFIKPLHYELVQLRVLELMHTAELVGPRSEETDRLETEIVAGIRAVGVPAHLKGYYYLRDAIRLFALSAAPVEINITKDIYPVIARLYGTRPPLVEHAMRTAIETAWTRGNLEMLHAYFGYTVNDNKGKPSNSEFVAMMAERVKAALKKR